jgi:shikimate kinase
MSGHVVLVGLSGSGKSTVGRLLAAALGRPLYDTDALLAERTGLPVPELLRRDEAGFRRQEEEVIAALAALPRGVVATGGGAVLSPRSRASLRTENVVVWLRAPVATLIARLAAGDAGDERPLLAGDAQVGLAALDHARAALYAACADHTVETAGLPPEEVAQQIQEIAMAWEVAHVR